MSLPSFVELMASLGLNDTPVVPLNRPRHQRAVSTSSQSTSTSSKHLSSPWASDSNVQTIFCPSLDSSVPPTADSHFSTASTRSSGTSFTSSYSSSSFANSPAITLSAAANRPSHSRQPSLDQPRERASSIGRRFTRYAPYHAESRDAFPRRGSLPDLPDEVSNALDEQSHLPSSHTTTPGSHPTSNQTSPTHSYFPRHANASSGADSFAVGTPRDNSSSLRQAQPRISRRARASKSHSHLRTASTPHHPVYASQLDPDMANTAPVAISSLLRRSEPTPTTSDSNIPLSAPPSAARQLANYAFPATAPNTANPLAMATESPTTPLGGKYLSSGHLVPEDHSRSFSQRRRRSALRDPPPPLSLPQLPSSLAIPSLPSLPPMSHSAGYVSKRTYHSPESGSKRLTPSWRARRITPPLSSQTLEVAMES